MASIESQAATAIADVRLKLHALGTADAVSILYFAATEDELRIAAPEVLGNDFGNAAWFALLHVWRASLFKGRLWLESRGDSLVAPPPPPVPVASAALSRLAFPPRPPSLLLVSTAASLARISAIICFAMAALALRLSVATSVR